MAAKDKSKASKPAKAEKLTAKNIDTEKSILKWKGEKVSGEHFGKIKFKEGKLDYTAKGQPRSGEFIVDMQSITIEDLEGEWAQKFIDHMKSDDFFSTAKHKTARLVINKVSERKPNVLRFEGELSIKGRSNPVSFDAKRKGENFEGRLVFDRTKYQIRYGSGSFFKDLGDKMIYDDVTLDFELALK